MAGTATGHQALEADDSCYPDASEMLASEQIVSLHHIDPWQSMLFVYGFGTLGLIGLAVFAFRLSARYRQLRRQAEASFVPNAPLALGATVVQGMVECAEGTTETLRIEVEQDGTELENSGIWSHQWTETSRRALVHPFYLRHASGARIRVNAREDVMLIDDMSGVIRVDLAKRIRVAELVPEKQIFAVGELRKATDSEGARVGSNRDQSLGYVLDPPRKGPMLLSSESLGQRFARREGFHQDWGKIIVMATIAFHLMMVPYHARMLTGRVVDARVTQMQELGQDDDLSHYRITMQSGHGRTLSTELPYFHRPRLQVGSMVRVRDVQSWPEAVAMGPLATARSTAHFGALLFVLLAGLYSWRTRMTLAWYERKKLVDTGNGRLAMRNSD